MSQEDAMNMSNEQAIQILKPFRDMMIDQHGCPISDAVFALDKAIEALSVQPEHRWIPCSERLPETSGTYLVSGMWASGRVAVGDCEYSSYDGYFNTAWNFDVIAWCELPEPYKERREE